MSQVPPPPGPNLRGNHGIKFLGCGLHCGTSRGVMASTPAHDRWMRMVRWMYTGHAPLEMDAPLYRLHSTRAINYHVCPSSAYQGTAERGADDKETK
ncbi:hypothetical protein E2C01_021433 [Portunus trituberculatus]|uniref:Uncharacterized protein n=1 Tax=Portunus trituberculatus TaxID=210409 RepID=A0A5B7E4D5_PORTR|nr:hypothetical protein [Portunus trituberculatus]